MTDRQYLLADYVTIGPEAAFQELVTRHVGLMYSTAIRFPAKKKRSLSQVY